MTIYYVDKVTGSDSDDGLTIGTAWENISKANSTLDAGDTALFRDGVYNQQILPANSGTSDSNRIIYKNYPNELPEIRDVTQNDAIYLVNKNYITVDGFKINGQNLAPSSNFKHWLYSYDSDHNEIINNVLERVNGWYGLRFEGTSTYNRIENNLIDHCGEWDSGGGVDYGNAMDFKDDADYTLIKGNIFLHGGHDLLELQTGHNVIRDNYFSNDWSDLEGAGKGNRSSSIKGKNSKLSRNLYEGNFVFNTGVASDTDYPKFCKIQGTHIICRNNVFDTAPHIGIAGRAPDGTDWVKDVRICHNVITNVGGPAWTAELGDNGLGVLDNKYFNNISYLTRSNLKKASFDCDMLIQANNNTGVSGHTFRGTEIKGNSIVSQVVDDGMINIKGLGIYSIAYMETNHASNVADNVSVVPVFKSSDQSQVSDYELVAAHALLGAGVALTNTDGSGTGTAITVNDALWFTDGWGVPTEVGDLIIVGSNEAVRITSINYNTNVLTVDTSITWADDDAVNLNYFGSAPNIGLVAGVDSPTPPPPPPPPPEGGGSGILYQNIYSNADINVPSLTITPPSTIADNKFLLALIITVEAQTIDTPAGWVLVHSYAAAGTGYTAPRLHVLTRTTSMEASSYTFTIAASGNGRIVGAILEYHDVVATPIDVSVLSAESSEVTTHDLSALSSTQTDSDILAITVLGGNSVSPTITPPSGYTERADVIAYVANPGKYLRLEVANKDGAGGTMAATTSESTESALSLCYHLSIEGIPVTAITFGASISAAATAVGSLQIQAGSTLSAPTSATVGPTSAYGTVVTSISNATLHFYASTNSSETASTIKASGSTKAVIATGVQRVAIEGVTTGVTYYIHFVAVDIALETDSNVVSSASFVTVVSEAKPSGGINLSNNLGL